jgi:hypothetical protein
MKRLLLSLFFFIPIIIFAQGIYQPPLLWGKKENRVITIYAQGIPGFRTILNDTAKLYPHIAFSTDTLRIWNPNLQMWVNVITGGGIRRNGLTAIGDTTMLGDSLDRYTYIQVLASQKEGSRYNQLRLGNKPVAQSLNGIINYPIYKSAYGPAIFYVERLFSTADGDVDSSFYDASAIFLTRTLRDSLDAEFGVGKRSEYLSNGGIYALNQYFPPRDTMIWRIGRDGQSGGTVFGQFDVGHTYGYKFNAISATDLPDFPISNIRSSIDLVRNIDNTRKKQMTGVGFTGFNSMYKSYQHAITMATFPSGSYWERMIDYTAYGDAYPLISGSTKAYTLGVAEVKQAIGFYSRPHYLYTNTVRDGYGFVARGDSDYNHLAFLNIGPYSTLPSRATNGNLSFTRRLYVNGDMESTGNSYAFVSVFMGGSVSIPIGIGTEAGINFLQRDSAGITGTLGSYLVPSNRALRGMYLRSEIFNGATMDNNSTGAFVQIETGVNHAFATRWWRNGGMVVNRVAAVSDVYRLYKKFVLNGGSIFSLNATDTVSIKNMPQGWVDSVRFKPLYRDVLSANGDLYQGYHPEIPITSLNGLTAGSQIFVASTAGVNFTINSSGSTHTFSLPDASNLARGVINTTTQTIKGEKTLTDKLSIQTASNSVGQSAALTAGSITISTTTVTANSLIFLTHSSIGGTQGILSVGTITPGTSFVINSSSATDTGTVNWWIIN